MKENCSIKRQWKLFDAQTFFWNSARKYRSKWNLNSKSFIFLFAQIIKILIECISEHFPDLLFHLDLFFPILYMKWIAFGIFIVFANKESLSEESNTIGTIFPMNMNCLPGDWSFSAIFFSKGQHYSCWRISPNKYDSLNAQKQLWLNWPNDSESSFILFYSPFSSPVLFRFDSVFICILIFICFYSLFFIYSPSWYPILKNCSINNRIRTLLKNDPFVRCFNLSSVSAFFLSISFWFLKTWIR